MVEELKIEGDYMDREVANKSDKTVIESLDN